MTLRYVILLWGLCLISCSSHSQDRITVTIPAAEAEATYIWRTIQDISFFEEHQYQLSLPQGQLIEVLKQKARTENLTNEDYALLVQFVTDSVYHKEDYQKGYERITKELPLMNQLIHQLDPSNFNWKFKTFDTYTVNLTLYGPGGSYDPDEGSILLFTTPKGEFKSYENPANTIIHEIVHIGIEESIIAQYDVPHALKEKIVDTFVYLYFESYLPEYQIQEMGETRTERYLNDRNDLKELDSVIDHILHKN